MYDQKMVLAVKSGGKILREFKDTVLLPFSSEYSLLIKNLNAARALVHVYIDGEDQTPSGLVINAGEECNFERSIKNGNLTEGNKFKFIQRTDSVEQHRGVQLEDGIVRIEFQFESQYQRSPWNASPAWPSNTDYCNIDYHLRRDAGNNHTSLRGFTGSVNQDSGADLTRVNVARMTAAMKSPTVQLPNDLSWADATAFIAMSVNHPITGAAQAYNDAGITVAGSKSTQHFSTTTMGLMEAEKYSIVLKILGETPDNKPVLDPVTVSSKTKCTTCGIQSKRTAQFCSNCGTTLTIY